MPKIKVVGMTKLKKKFKDNVTMNDVKRVVLHNGQEMQQKIVENADFKMGYQTGATKRSIRGETEDMGLTYVAGPTTEYSEYVNWGTRFMDAQPFVTDAYNEQKKKFKKDMDKLAR